jgi:hypothetical protein
VSEECSVFHYCSLSIIYHFLCWHTDLRRLFPLQHVPNQFIRGKPTLNSFGKWKFYWVSIFFLNRKVLKSFGFYRAFYGHNKFLFLSTRYLVTCFLSKTYLIPFLGVQITILPKNLVLSVQIEMQNLPGHISTFTAFKMF